MISLRRPAVGRRQPEAHARAVRKQAGGGRGSCRLPRRTGPPRAGAACGALPGRRRDQCIRPHGSPHTPRTRGGDPAGGERGRILPPGLMQDHRIRPAGGAARRRPRDRRPPQDARPTRRRPARRTPAASPRAATRGGGADHGGQTQARSNGRNDAGKYEF